MKININNEKKLKSTLDKVQKNNRVRTITYNDVLYFVKHIEESLMERLFKKDWIELEFEIDPHSQRFPASYQGTPESTKVKLLRCPTGWFVTDVFREYVNQSRTITPINLCKKGDELALFAMKNMFNNIRRLNAT